VSADELPPGPWTGNRDDPTEAMERTRTLWRALDGIEDVDELIQAMGALDPEDCRWLVFVRCLLDRVDAQRSWRPRL
jgi:hypothetical protein